MQLTDARKKYCSKIKYDAVKSNDTTLHKCQWCHVSVRSSPVRATASSQVKWRYDVWISSWCRHRVLRLLQWGAPPLILPPPATFDWNVDTREGA